MKKSTALNRKTSRLIAKNLIILLVLAVITFLTIWAWFTKGTSAEAEGISIKSMADGVDVSWDNTNFYKNLTALTDDDVVEKQVGLAKNISGKKGEAYPIKLVTGNGLKFFEPYLNRRTGDVLLNADNSWQGIDIANSEGKYVEIPLYFRGTGPKDIYLVGDSFVSPKSTDARMSEFGDFSTDYICAASRVAFLDSTKNNCSFIWAPNSNYELEETENGYTRYTTTDTETITEQGGNNGNLDGGATEDGNKYYLWSFKDELIDTYDKAQNSDYLEAREFKYDSAIKYYVTEFDFYVPTYEQNNPSIPLIINTSSTKDGLSNSDNVNINGSGSHSISNVKQHFYIVNGDFKLDENSTSPITATNKMYPDSRYIKSGERMSLTLGYNPETNILTVLMYECSGGDSFDIGLGEETITTTVTYYPLEGGVNATLVSPEASVAISAGDELGKAVSFKNADKKNVLPRSVMLTEQFTVEKTGEKSKATYKFKNKKTNKWLTITNGNISFTDSGTSFSLAYFEDFSGPALKAGNYYLVAQNGELKGVTEANLEKKNLITVYVGSSYILHTSSNASQNYEYYDSTEKNLITLGENSTPKLFYSATNTADTVKIGNTKVATLAKTKETDEYYTAMIYIRIWAEGTDRDAKTPLANGIFDTSLHFTAK